MQHSPRPELPAAVPPLSFAPQRTTGALSFPHGATAVTIDEKGRIKLPTRLGGLRSWCEGALDVVIVAGWAIEGSEFCRFFQTTGGRPIRVSFATVRHDIGLESEGRGC